MPINWNLSSRRTNQLLRQEEDKIHDDLWRLYGEVSSLVDATSGFIPLSGTVEGSPVTGNIRILGDTYDYEEIKLFLEIYDDPEGGLDTENYISFGNGTNPSIEIVTHNKTTETKKFIRLFNGDIEMGTLSGDSGITIESLVLNNITGIKHLASDFTEIEPDNNLIYAQRAYVDRAVSYSTTETLTGGTWIDGKPIYRKVTTYDIPTDMQAGSGNSIIELGSLIDESVNYNLKWIENGGFVYKGLTALSTSAIVYKDGTDSFLQFIGNTTGTGVDLDFIDITQVELTIDYTKTTD